MFDVTNMSGLIDRYFSSEAWLIIFLISTLYLFFRMNKLGKRAFLAAVVAFFMVINTLVIKQFTRFGENATFYRHLWVIPSATIIGIAIVDLLNNLPGWFFKISAIMTFVIVFWFVNNQEYIRCRELHLSKDAKMVQNEVIILSEGLERIHQESAKDTMYVLCPTGHGVQYGDFDNELNLYCGFLNVFESSFLTDTLHNGEEELTGENPDVSYIMEKCCNNGIDYVIASCSDNSEKIYAEAGYLPLLKTGKYDVFKCEGFSGYKQELSNWGQIIWKYWYDEAGNVIPNEAGYCRLENTYDNKGRLIRELYMDDDGKKICCSEGYAEIEREYNFQGDIKEYRLLDAEGNPCRRTGYGYSAMRYTWDTNRHLSTITYIDEKGEMGYYTSSQPYAVVTFSYDERGNCISEQYYDATGNPAKSSAGFDELRREFNALGQFEREFYYSDGKLINRIDGGYAEIVREYDGEGLLVREIFRDMKGNEVSK